jgi:polyhydroxyalkanoate synthase subunit PhaE
MSADPWGGWQAFSDAARSYLSSGTQASPQTAAQQFSDFLREQFATYSQPWMGAQAAPAAAAPSPTLSTELPAFGVTREHQQRAQRMADALQRMNAAQRRLQRLWSDVLRDAAARYVSQLAPTQPPAATPDALRKLYDSWIDCAEEAYARIAHGEAFCQAQAEFANAASQWRLEQQTNIEHWSRFLDLPTRSEVNSLIRRLQVVEAQLQSRSPVANKQAAPRRKTPGKRAHKGKKRT